MHVIPPKTAEIRFSDYPKKASISVRATMRNYRTILEKVKPKPLEPFIGEHFRGFGSKSESSNYISMEKEEKRVAGKTQCQRALQVKE